MKYRFDTEGLTDYVAKLLANRKEELTESEKEELMNGAFRGLAILEYPTVDVELDIWNTILYGEDDDKIIPSYFACIKGVMPNGEEEWASDEEVDWDVNVDFSAPDWREQLERDMHDALMYHAAKHGYSLDEPNFERLF